MFFYIPGQLISLVTFPGVIVHEIAHHFFADISGVPVYKICYFRMGDPAGYVIHGEALELKQAFLISIGPLIINSLLCILITSTFVYPLLIFDDHTVHFTNIMAAWIGFSIGMHAFPSNQDTDSFLQALDKSDKDGILIVISNIFAVIIKIANFFKAAWFDLFYAIGLSYMLPAIIGY